MTKEKRKRIGECLFAVLLVVLICFWYINDGLYLVKKITYTDIEMIEEFTEIDFPEDTIVKEMKIEPDIFSFFLNHNEILEATIDVPREKIDELFPKEYRLPDNHKDIAACFADVESIEEVEFGMFLPETIVNGTFKYNRKLYITVMRSKSDFTTVHVWVNGLGC